MQFSDEKTISQFNERQARFSSGKATTADRNYRAYLRARYSGQVQRGTPAWDAMIERRANDMAD